MVYSLLLGSARVPAQLLAFELNTVGAPAGNARRALQPGGPKAVSDRAGGAWRRQVRPHDRIRARRLASWGYIALPVHGFRLRGATTGCRRGMTPPPR